MEAQDTANREPILDKTITIIAASIACGYDLLREVVNNKTGSNTRLVRVAASKVSEVSQPRALVPPNPLNTKMTNPAINTREV